MAWYLRKSLSFGPLRINLSKSGLGGSVGVKGFRVGTGPGGRYLHAGRGGLYYKTRLDGPHPSSNPAPDDEPLETQATQPDREATPALIDPAVSRPDAPGQNQFGVRLFRSILNAFKGP